MKRSRIAGALAVAALILNAVVLFNPSPGGPPPFAHVDKVVHLGIFALPAGLGVLAGWQRQVFGGGLAAYAGASELVQEVWLSQRSGSIADLLADLLGIGAGMAVAGLLVRRHTRQ